MDMRTSWAVPHRQGYNYTPAKVGEVPLFISGVPIVEKEIPETSFSCKVLTGDEELDSAYRHRHDVFIVEKGIAEATNYPNGREHDEYDPFSLHVALLQGDDIVAYTRLVLPCDEFPLERTNDIPSHYFNRRYSVEVSRALIVKEYRRCANNAIWHLFNSVYEICQERGVETMLSFSNTIMYNGYKKRGVPFAYVGEPVLFHGHQSHPLVISVDRNRPPNFLLH